VDQRGHKSKHLSPRQKPSRTIRRPATERLEARIPFQILVVQKPAGVEGLCVRAEDAGVVVQFAVGDDDGCARLERHVGAYVGRLLDGADGAGRGCQAHGFEVDCFEEGTVLQPGFEVVRSRTGCRKDRVDFGSEGSEKSGVEENVGHCPEAAFVGVGVDPGFCQFS